MLPSLLAKEGKIIILQAVKKVLPNIPLYFHLSNFGKLYKQHSLSSFWRVVPLLFSIALHFEKNYHYAFRKCALMGCTMETPPYTKLAILQFYGIYDACII